MENQTIHQETDPGSAVSSSYQRHPLATRLLHWTSAIAIFTLLWTGFWIFNIHPRLYWGDVGNFDTPALAELTADTSTSIPEIFIKVGDYSLEVTGLIGQVRRMPFIRVAAYPEGFKFGGNRALHFTAAWAFVFGWLLFVYHLISSGRLRDNWLPKTGEMSPRNIGRDILNHLKLRRAHGDAAKHYNILQKLAYLIVMFAVLPLMLLTGLTMSNSVTTAWPFLFDLFGGRQSARTLHFIFAFLVLLFILIHVLQLFVAGFINHLRGMITGVFHIKVEKKS
ncbi:MAG: hypothetical protein COA96_03010 [SAR86 cluster bacterium]|uniref:Cytochrome b561 bacterial/Ni-hydrogenase domain-containing protein n=1 Tax=SAR86 cluster bacterium TaxID=2030880 RepID=A0A2A5B7C6_9GAMM|nr:MAG: hypothetical protein COA96_03010 [SAR86 cluster bacterium]